MMIKFKLLHRKLVKGLLPRRELRVIIFKSLTLMLQMKRDRLHQNLLEVHLLLLLLLLLLL